MKVSATGFLSLLLAGALATPSWAATRTGFVNLPRAVASHPLHRILAQYDREIAALESTKGAPGLGDPVASAERGAAALQANATVAAARAEAIGTHDAPANRAREQTAIARVLRSQRAPSSGIASYTSELVSETNANVRAYSGAISERTQRAYAARQQQLREKELMLAYDVERRDAGKRLMLRLKLDDLHLNAARRARLEAQLGALDAGELRSVNALRRADVATLAAYRAELQSTAATAAGEMDEQLRSKAGANYAILRRVFNEADKGFGAFPWSSQLQALHDSDGAASSAHGIAAGMRSAEDDLSRRFARDGTVDAQSQRDIAAQVRTLQANRAALYRSIVAQIKAAAQAIAQERHVANVAFVEARLKTGGVDLTGPVESRVARAW